MITWIALPEWLDSYIFDELGAKYCPSKGNMTVINWNKSDVLNYLGTYFPRSFTEAYCIFSDYFAAHKAEWESKESLYVFDFGCGTGGEIIGLAFAVKEHLPHVRRIDGVALDGNQHALRLYEKTASLVSKRIGLEISLNVAPIVVCDFYDLTIVDDVINLDFDIFMSFKAICEFVTKDRFEQKNAYEHIATTFMPKLKAEGIMMLVDVTTYNNTAHKWLPDMMDQGLRNFEVIGRNAGYNQSFYVNHSRRQKDLSKVVWRIVKRHNN